jgi:hypothetical protein
MSIAEHQGPPVLHWRNAIGDFILAFGGCEYWTHAYIRKFGPQVIHEVAAKMEITSRAALAKAIVLDKAASTELKRRIEMIFKSFSSLTKCRNLVAHNVPSFMSQQIMVGVDLKMHIVSPQKKGSLTLKALQQHVIQAETLLHDMEALYLAIRPPHPGKPKAVFSDGKSG